MIRPKGGEGRWSDADDKDGGRCREDIVERSGRALRLPLEKR